MKNCALQCMHARECCTNQECRLWIDYEEDLNCTSIAINKHGPMTLEQIAKRHSLSTVRIKQILDATLGKLKKRLVKTITI
jgi:hypothetical protein